MKQEGVRHVVMLTGDRKGIAEAVAEKLSVSVMETAGEGGAWGIALLADYMKKKEASESLQDFLNNETRYSRLTRLPLFSIICLVIT